MIKDLFLPYDISLKLKELGFNEKCLATIDQTEYLHIKGTKSLPRGSMVYDTIDCPLYQQVFDWFREKHNICASIFKNDKDMLEYVASKGETYLPLYYWRYTKENSHAGDSAMTYRECEIACINKLIELIKNG